EVLEKRHGNYPDTKQPSPAIRSLLSCKLAPQTSRCSQSRLSTTGPWHAARQWISAAGSTIRTTSTHGVVARHANPAELQPQQRPLRNVQQRAGRKAQSLGDFVFCLTFGRARQ